VSKIETVMFYGRTESEIEQNFLEWQKEYAGRTRILKKHDIDCSPACKRSLLNIDH
jgi:hypothetical protein